jgi:hypothetical protein
MMNFPLHPNLATDCMAASRRAIVVVVILFLGLCSVNAMRAVSAESPAQCQASCPGKCRIIESSTGTNSQGNTERLYAECLNQCKTNCNPPTTTVIKPRYLIVAMLYAPPGCSGINGTQCANFNLGDAGTSLVDYGSGSANGSKVSTADSFKESYSVSVDGGGSDPAVSLGASYAATYSNSNSVNVTKAVGTHIKAYGNGDGIDHGQDQIVLLLDSTVTLTQQSNKIRWKLDSGDPYPVYVSELRNPTTMRPAIAAQLKALGFTNDDYQTILSMDPYGGRVCPTGPFGITATCSTNAPPNGSANPPSDDVELNPKRFAQTTWTFPYAPPVASPTCPNGICTCDVFSANITNDTQTDVQVGLEQDYGVEIKTNIGLEDVTGLSIFGLKSDTQFTWTSTSTTDNTTDASRSSQVNIACPSANYKDPRTLMQIWWDSLYGSFFFIQVELSASDVFHQGMVANAAGKALGGELVELSYGGKTYHTFTSPDGRYRFAKPARGKTVSARTGILTVGKTKRAVTLGSQKPAVIKL